MSQAGSSWTSLAMSCALLALCIAPAAAIAARISTQQWSMETLRAAAIGGAICWVAASFALTATYLGNRLQSPVQGVLAGMVFRLGLPLAALLVLQKVEHAAIPPGTRGTILGVYLVALVVETGLALRMIAIQPRAVKAV
jgi:hypothetical protein